MPKAIRETVTNVAPHWVGDGFPVRSLFSYAGGNRFDPFLLLDYAGPHTFSPATAPRGVGEHPHRGFETVTIVYQGELEHRDSSGSHGSIGSGDVQWMTAASGVVHEEFHSERFTREGGTLEMVQLWVNLPARDKMTAPRYQHLPSERIPQVTLDGSAGTVRVIAGEFAGQRGAARTFSPLEVWDVQLSAGSRLDARVPAGHTTLLVVQSGEIEIQTQRAKAVELLTLDATDERLEFSAVSPARILVLAGKPLGEPVAGQGPFVMNTREEIVQAIDDYRQGRMGRLE